MQLSLSSDIFNPFWDQLFRNIGYSKAYKRYVIVEPVCYLIESKCSISKCVPIDPIVYGWDLGSEVATYIDIERSDYLDQALVPYISDNNYKYILLSDHPLIFPQQRLPKFLNYLQRNPHILKRVRGLVHYHINEPKNSKDDLQSMTRYTKEVKALDGSNQIGIVLSERDPNDTLEIKKSENKKRFIHHLSIKLKKGKIDVVGDLFTGEQGFHSPLEIRLDL